VSVRRDSPTLRTATLGGVVGRRLAAAPFLILAALTLVFLMIQAVPGEPFHDAAGPGVDPQALEHLRNLFQPDIPLGKRYLRWLGQIASGDLGFSTALRRSVGPLVLEAGANTVRLVGVVLVFQFVAGVVGGCVAAAGRGRWIDTTVRSASAISYATPGFVVGLGLIAIFASGLGWLPATQMESIDVAAMSTWAAVVDRLRHLVMPCLALGIPGAAAVALYTRETLGAVLDRPFLQGARSRGLGPARVLLRHGLRNSLLPIVQLFGLSLPGLVGGSVVVETLFAWPGMGRLAYHAVLARDEPLVLGCTLLAVVGVLLGSLVADLLSAALDPRIREHP